MRKFSAAVAVGGVLWAGVVAPAAAHAETATAAVWPASAPAGGRCAAYGIVRTITSVVDVHTGTGTGYRVVKTLYRGTHVSCRPLTAGAPDARCGPSCRPPSPRRNA
ncbi:hypothetical protein [Amycolatopsis sp. lyj-23]|uniref:hypothetical protein n=1 Tax=Amycolatopsis sp. lyj-23 TaxID=2789283 RepID=UPI00397E285D